MHRSTPRPTQLPVRHRRIATGVSQWRHDFAPDLSWPRQRAGGRGPRRSPVGITATRDPRTRAEIRDAAGLEAGRVFTASFERDSPTIRYPALAPQTRTTPTQLLAFLGDYQTV